MQDGQRPIGLSLLIAVLLLTSVHPKGQSLRCEGSFAMAGRGTSIRKFVIALPMCVLSVSTWPGLGGTTAYAGAPQSGGALKRVQAIDLPGPPGRRFDYLAIDDGGEYLFSAHLAAGLVYVIDLRTNSVVKAIPDVPGIEGVAHIPELQKLLTTDFWENKIGVIDLREMRVVKKLPTEAKPDGIAYAPPFGKAYVSNERAKAESVIDVREDKIVKVLRFESETGAPQYDPVARRIYVNLQDDNVFAVIDPATDTIVGRYPVAGCRGNHGMAVDANHHRAFLACQGNDVLAIFNLDTHQAIAHFPLPKGADVVAFDPGLGRIYVACSSGAISVFQEIDADHFTKLEDVPVEKKVHSLAVDVRTHRVYAPEEQEGGQPVARMVIFEPITGVGGVSREAGR
jgi:DNA-binding beta-propeller fold protein YncE